MEFPLRAYWKCLACETIHFEIVDTLFELSQLAHDVEQSGAWWMITEALSAPLAELTVQ